MVEFGCGTWKSCCPLEAVRAEGGKGGIVANQQNYKQDVETGAMKRKCPDCEGDKFHLFKAKRPRAHTLGRFIMCANPDCKSKSKRKWLGSLGKSKRKSK